MVIVGTRDSVFAERLRADLRKAHNRLTFLRAERSKYPDDTFVAAECCAESDRIERLNALLEGGTL